MTGLNVSFHCLTDFSLLPEVSNMVKKIIAFALALSAALSLAGCGSILDKEYVYIADYSPAAQTEQISGDRVSVKSIVTLKKALIGFVENGAGGGTVVFDPAYEGDPVQDMQKAVWEIRTRNALCAYCVEAINYELSKIVTYYEAVVRIGYSENYPVSDIVKLSYAIGIDNLIENALKENLDRLVLYISTSTLSIDNIKNTVNRIYRENPLICVSEPSVTVNMYSGNLNQRLFEINFSYGLSESELIKRKSQLVNLEFLTDPEISAEDSYGRLLAGCGYLVNNCVYVPDSNLDTAYDALVNSNADSEGLALAFVEVCNRLGCSCVAVEGQKDRVKHFWNIVKVDDFYYHVDVSACIEEGMYSGFLLSDERMWSSYRWDLSSYSRCEGPVLYDQKSGTASHETDNGTNAVTSDIETDDAPKGPLNPDDSQNDTH